MELDKNFENLRIICQLKGWQTYTSDKRICIFNNTPGFFLDNEHNHGGSFIEAQHNTTGIEYQLYQSRINHTEISKIVELEWINIFLKI